MKSIYLAAVAAGMSVITAASAQTTPGNQTSLNIESFRGAVRAAGNPEWNAQSIIKS